MRTTRGSAPEARLDQSASRWKSISQVEDFRVILGEQRRNPVVCFALACVGRIRSLLIPDAINLANSVESCLDGRVERSKLLEVYNKFLQCHYTPRIVPSQGDPSVEIDIGEFDFPGSEAVAGVTYLCVGDLVHPDDDRFQTTRKLFWIAQGVAENCRHTVMAQIPDLPWHQEELPPDLERFREPLLGLSRDQRRQLHRSPESDPMLHAVESALIGASTRRSEQRNHAWENEELEQCNLVREVILPPFVTSFASSWRTPDVLDVASGIYQSQEFSRMPILAEALRQAGCDDEYVLGHCRNTGNHVRGCWVLDLVLSKT